MNTGSENSACGAVKQKLGVGQMALEAVKI